MHHFFKILLIVIALFYTASLQAKDVSVDLRALYVNYDYDHYFKDSEAFATSVKLSYKKVLSPNLEAGLAFGDIEDFGLNDMNKQSTTYIYSDVYTGKEKRTYALLHQAYLKYTLCKSFIQAGRFEFSSPLIDSDDYYLLSNSFEGITTLLNFDKVDVQFGYISKMSGAWDAGYDGATFQSMSRSPWMHKADKGTNNWPNPYLDFNVTDSGIGFAGITYNNEDYKFQLWDYYAFEVINSIYTQLDMKFAFFDIALQYNTFNEVGQMKQNTATNSIIDYSVWGAKIATEVDNVGLNLAYTGVSDNESAHLFGSWGGYPYFASGMMTSYFEASLRGAHIYALNAELNPMQNLSSTLHIGYYDLNKNYTKLASVNAANGEEYMYTYGISNSYKIDNNFSFLLKLAGRRFDSGNEAKLFRMLLKYVY